DQGIRGSFPSLAPQAVGGGVIACYEQKMGNQNQDIYCARIDSQGRVTLTTPITETAYDSLSPQAIQHGRDTWVIFADQAGQVPTIQWQFLDGSGAAILPEPKDSAVSGWRAHGAIAKDGLYFLEYHTDSRESAWIAEAATVNCF